MEEQLIEALNNINEKLDIALEQQLTQRAKRKASNARKRRGIIERREEMGMTQKDLADAVGVSAAWMSQIEREIKEPSLAIGLELAKVLECDADDLIN